MTETPPEASPDVSHDHPQDEPFADDATERDPKRVAAWIGLGISILVGVVALFHFYRHAVGTIFALVPEAYQDPFLAGFHLAMLLVAGAAALVLVRTLREPDAAE